MAVSWLDRRCPRPDLIITEPHQRLQFLQAGIDRCQSPQPMPVGAQVVGELVAVTWIRLRPGGAPPRPGSEEGGGMHRHHRMARRASSRSTTRPLVRSMITGRHRAADRAVRSRSNVVNQPVSECGTPTGPAPHRPHRAPSHRGPRLAQSKPTYFITSLPSESVVDSNGVEALRRFLIVRPSVGHVPNAGPGPRRVEGGSTKTGRHSGSATRPSPDTTEKPRSSSNTWPHHSIRQRTQPRACGNSQLS